MDYVDAYVDTVEQLSSVKVSVPHTLAQLGRTHERDVGARGDDKYDPIVLDSDDEQQPLPHPPPPPPQPAPAPVPQPSPAGPSSSYFSAVAVIDIPASELRAQLQVRESGIVPSQPGLFAVRDVPANTLVSAYTFDRAVSEHTLLAMSDKRRKGVSRYAVEGPDGVTFILNLPVDGQTHPAAMSNEPLDGKNANMQLHGQRVFQADGSGHFILALYTCNSAVVAGTELTWNYSKSYQQVRDEERYSAGIPCRSKEPLSPSMEKVVNRVLEARGEGGADGVLYPVAPWVAQEEELRSEHDADSDYEERGRVRPQQPRRQQPQRKQRVGALYEA